MLTKPDSGTSQPPARRKKAAALAIPEAAPARSGKSTCSRFCMACMARTAQCRDWLKVARTLVGCGIIGSANALDKDIAKRLFNEAGVLARSNPHLPDAAPSFPADLGRNSGLPLFIKSRHGRGLPSAWRGLPMKWIIRRADRRTPARHQAACRGIHRRPRGGMQRARSAPDGNLSCPAQGRSRKAENHGFLHL